MIGRLRAADQQNLGSCYPFARESH